MSEPANKAAAVVTALRGGMSTRSQACASEGAVSNSAASRHWIEATAAKISELWEREWRGTEFFGLMLDGVALAADAVVVVALGLTRDGHKVLLDFEPGASENTAVAKTLVARLQARGFAPIPRATGSSRCSMVPLRCKAPCSPPGPTRSSSAASSTNNVISTAICAAAITPNRRACGGACVWPKAPSPAAKPSPSGGVSSPRATPPVWPVSDEAGDQLIALHRLNVPATLHLSLLSTNAIENVMRNYRGQTAKVTRWQPATDQISRWTATALLQVETGFRSLKGHADLPKLLQSLALPSLTHGDGGCSLRTQRVFTGYLK